jgi:hypothetical protein
MAFDIDFERHYIHPQDEHKKYIQLIREWCGSCLAHLAYIDISHISASQLTDADDNVVERQVITLGDAVTEANIANVTAAGALQVDGLAITQPTNLQPQAAVFTGAVIDFDSSDSTL